MMLVIGARHPQRGSVHHPTLKNTDADRVGGDEWRKDPWSRSHASQTGVHLLLYKIGYRTRVGVAIEHAMHPRNKRRGLPV